MVAEPEDRRPVVGLVAADALEDAGSVVEPMCTDVDRNDKSRICVPGSVRVIGRRAVWVARSFSAARTAASLVSRAASRVRATSRFSGSTWSY